MHYGDLKPHVAEGLIELRKRIDSAKIPPSKLDESLNVATWNIREFGRKKRLDASIVYIAEIINQFDLVALVELRDNLGDLIPTVLDIDLFHRREIHHRAGAVRAVVQRTTSGS